MESSFALPPPAWRSTEPRPQSATSKGDHSHPPAADASQNTPPVSPKDKPLPSSPRHKRTLSGSAKLKHDSGHSTYTLPPPPSRARKIIQMKPKSSPTTSSSASDASYQPATLPSKNGSASTGSKRKQPSATSAAGRKIARKTAHSIIERRRRSKMNEEFGVLKDMIPACHGVEMHKLAILQAGIEYVRYLEGCIAQLKAESTSRRKSKGPAREESDEEDEGAVDDEDDDDDDDDDEKDEARRQPRQEMPKRPHPAGPLNEDWPVRDARQASIATTNSSSYPSPDVQAQAEAASRTHKRPMLPGPGSLTASPSHFSIHSASATPTPTLLSPAFNSIHFSPDLARTHTSSTAATGLSMTGSNSSCNPSPNILPLPQAALPLPGAREYNNKSPALSEGGAEATATAALMMLTNDRRGAGVASHRGKGMSVRDLLSS